jgi:hypothetical protein
MTLYLICDTSGSMSEDGKCLITRGMALAVGQYYRLGYGKGELKLIAWSNEARIVEWIPENEYPPEMLDCKGVVNAESLIKLLGGQIDGKVLLLTDGFWSHDAEKALKRWKNTLLPDTLRIIRIGADPNTNLKEFVMFSAEDFFDALDGWGKET